MTMHPKLEVINFQLCGDATMCGLLSLAIGRAGQCKVLHGDQTSDDKEYLFSIMQPNQINFYSAGHESPPPPPPQVLEIEQKPS
jgi:hypothetical protein